MYVHGYKYTEKNSNMRMYTTGQKTDLLPFLYNVRKAMC